MKTFSTKRDRFSLRKYKGIGLASCLLGSLYLGYGPVANAEEMVQPEIETIVEDILDEPMIDVTNHSEIDSAIDVVDEVVPVPADFSGFRTAQDGMNVELITDTENRNYEKLKITFDSNAVVRNGSEFVLNVQNMELGDLVNSNDLRINEVVVGKLSYDGYTNASNTTRPVLTEYYATGIGGLTKEDLKAGITDTLNAKLVYNMKLTFNEKVENFSGGDRVLYIPLRPDRTAVIERRVEPQGLKPDGKALHRLYGKKEDLSEYLEHYNTEKARLADNQRVVISHNGSTIKEWNINYKFFKGWFGRDFASEDVDTEFKNLHIARSRLSTQPNHHTRVYSTDPVISEIEGVPGNEYVIVDDGTMNGAVSAYNMKSPLTIEPGRLRVTMRLAEDSIYTFKDTIKSEYVFKYDRHIQQFEPTYSDDGSVFEMNLSRDGGATDPVFWTVNRVSDREIVFENKNELVVNAGDSPEFFSLKRMYDPVTLDKKYDAHAELFKMRSDWRSHIRFDDNTVPVGFTMIPEYLIQGGGMGALVPSMDVLPPQPHTDYHLDRATIRFRNTGVGEDSTGTVIARLYDGDRLIESRNVAVDKSWKTTYDFTAPTLEGYRFDKIKPKSEYQLSGFVGVGTHYIDLNYISNVTVGTDTETIPMTIRYVADPNRDYGTRETTTQGQDGSREYRTENGRRVGDGTVRTPMIERVVHVGTRMTDEMVRTTGRTETVNFRTRYVADPSQPKGSANVAAPTGGTNGKRYYYKEYTVDAQHGTYVEGAERERTSMYEAPVDRVITVATGGTVDRDPITRTMRYVEDPSRTAGEKHTQEEGRDGELITTRTYTLKNENSDEVVPNVPTTRRVDPVDKVVKVGTKPKVDVQTTPRIVRYVADPTAERDNKTTQTEGRDGTRTTTTNYRLNTNDGTVTPLEPVVENVEMVGKVVKVGTQPKVEVETITRTVRYIADPSAIKDSKATDTEGRDGTRTTTTTYTVNEQDGTTTAGQPETVVVDPVTKVVKVGTQPKVEVETITRTVRYIADPSALKDSRATDTEGSDGTRTTTTTYTVNEQDGTTIASEPKTVVVDPVTKVVKVGTQPTVSRVNDALETVYEADDQAERNLHTTADNGVVGYTETTVYWSVDETSGAVTEARRENRHENGTPKRVKVGTQPKVDVETITRTTRYIADPSAVKDSKATDTEGRDGTRTTTTTYTVNPQDGTLIAGQPTTVVVDPVVKVVKVGTQPTVTRVDDALETVYEADDQAERNSHTTADNGVVGYTETTVYWSVDEASGAVTEARRENRHENGTPKRVKVGTMPKVDVVAKPKTITYVEDIHRNHGDQHVTDAGQDGSITTTTTYTVNPADGSLIASEPNVVTVEPRNTVTMVGTKPTVMVETVPIPVEYVPLASEDVEARDGSEGSVTTTIRYRLDTATGKVTPLEPEVVRVSATSRIVKVDTTDKVTVTPIKRTIRYKADPTLAYGKTAIEIEGRDGSITETIEYDINQQDGSLVEKNRREETVDPIDQLVRVGTMTDETVTQTDMIETMYLEDDKIEADTRETIQDGSEGQTIRVTTYQLDESIGIVTPVISERRVEMEKRIIRVGTKPRIIEEILEIPVEYVEDEAQTAGDQMTDVEGQTGLVSTMISYTVDPMTGELVEVDRVVTRTEPKVKVVKVGTKSKVVETVLPKQNVFVEDTTLAGGKTREVDGKDGVRTEITRYILDKSTGTVTEGDVVVNVTDAVHHTTHVGTAPTKVVTDAPINVVYKGDDSRQVGDDAVVEGAVGKLITTTYYRYEDGKAVVDRTEEVIEGGSAKIVTKGSAPLVVRETLPMETRYVGDDGLETGKQSEGESGKARVKITTTTYTVDEKTGELIASTPIETFEGGRATVVKVGTQPKVVTDDAGNKYKVYYDVDPNSGKLIEKHRELLESNEKVITVDDVIEVPETPENDDNMTSSDEVESNDSNDMLPNTGDVATLPLAIGFGLSGLTTIIGRKRRR